MNNKGTETKADRLLALQALVGGAGGIVSDKGASAFHSFFKWIFPERCTKGLQSLVKDVNVSARTFQFS